MAKASKPKKLHIQEVRMLELIEDAIKSRFATREEFYDRIGLHRQNVSKIKRGEHPFNQKHIYEACKALNVNANWVFGFEEQKYRTAPKTPPIQRIKEALADLETELKKKK